VVDEIDLIIVITDNHGAAVAIRWRTTFLRSGVLRQFLFGSFEMCCDYTLSDVVLNVQAALGGCLSIRTTFGRRFPDRTTLGRSLRFALGGLRFLAPQ
jgi:hypothetical protein